MKKLIAFVLLFLAALSAEAGQKNDGGAPAMVYRYSDGALYIAGSLGNVRASSDTQSYIGCSLYTYKMSDGSVRTNAWCMARNQLGEYGSCSTQEPQYVATVAALNSDSYIGIYINAQGQCSTIDVQTMSTYRCV